MTTLTEAYMTLATTLETVFSVAPVRGWPRWSRDAKATRAVAMLLATSTRLKVATARKRSKDYGIQVVIFAEDEDDLFNMVETAENWLDTTKNLITAGGSDVKLVWDAPASRHINESGLVTEDYGFVYQLRLTW